jgi:hypothetical protein
MHSEATSCGNNSQLAEDGNSGHTTATLNSKMAKEMLGLKKEAKQLHEQLASKTKQMEEMEVSCSICLICLCFII